MAQTVKRLPAVQEAWVRPLGWEDPLEKDMATHSSMLACKIPWTEEPGGCSMGSPRVRPDWQAQVHEITYNHEDNRAKSSYFKGEFSRTFSWQFLPHSNSQRRKMNGAASLEERMHPGT